MVKTREDDRKIERQQSPSPDRKSRITDVKTNNCDISKTRSDSDTDEKLDQVSLTCPCCKTRFHLVQEPYEPDPPEEIGRKTNRGQTKRAKSSETSSGIGASTTERSVKVIVGGKNDFTYTGGPIEFSKATTKGPKSRVKRTRTIPPTTDEYPKEEENKAKKKNATRAPRKGRNMESNLSDTCDLSKIAAKRINRKTIKYFIMKDGECLSPEEVECNPDRLDSIPDLKKMDDHAIEKRVQNLAKASKKERKKVRFVDQEDPPDKIKISKVEVYVGNVGKSKKSNILDEHFCLRSDVAKIKKAYKQHGIGVD